VTSQYEVEFYHHIRDIAMQLKRIADTLEAIKDTPAVIPTAELINKFNNTSKEKP
jgi:hypothetical protein